MSHPLLSWSVSCIVASSAVAAPLAPSDLRVTPLGATSQVLAWVDNSNDETGFAIERLDGTDWTPVTSVAANTTRQVLTSQPTGTQTYRVSSINGSGASAPTTPASTLRMNILFFLADDMGHLDIVANRNPATDGPTIYETPALDTLKSQGVSFTNAYCSGPKCVVARRALQTGMYDYRAAAIAKNGGIGAEMVTMGEAMKASGYRTCFIGKWHLGGVLDGSTPGGDEDFSSGGLSPHLPPVYKDWSALDPSDNKYIPATDPNHFEGNKTPAAQGYDVAIATGEWGAPPISYFANAATGTAGEYWYGLPDLYSMDPGEYLTDRLTTEAIGFMNNAITSYSTQPFFITLAHYAVHTPLEAKADRITYYENKRAAMAADFAAHPAGAAQQVDFSSKVRMHQDQPIYAAMMESFDQSLANIRNYLAATNDPRNPGMKLAETTIIILSSDHGGKSTHWINSGDTTPIPTSNYPLRQGKTWVYEGGLKIPLIVYWPGINSANTSSSAFVNGADFYTSILDMTGAPRMPSQHLDSISFAECVVSPSAMPRTENPHWFTNADTGTGNPALGAYRLGDYKLVYDMIRRLPELYNLSEDIGEQNDISSLRPDLVNEFLRRLITVRDSVEARQPLPTSVSWTKELEVIGPVLSVPAAVPAGSPPSGLAGTSVSDSAIDLTWTDNTSNEERFVIQRKLTGGGAFLEVATVSANVTRFRDTGLTPNTSYQYRIQAENLKGWNGPSNQITISTTSSAVLPIIARGDDITTLQNETRVFQPLNTDQGKNLVITGITQPAGLGTAGFTGTTITFVPGVNATGSTTMTYTVTDVSSATTTGSVLITILADHTVTPPLVYDLSPVGTDIDVWEFNDADGTRLDAAAKAAGSSVFTTSATPTIQSGNLRFAQGAATGSIFRNATIASGLRVLGNSNSGTVEMSFRITSADLSGGANNSASPAYIGVGTRGKDALNGNSDPIQIRLQESSGNLILQARGASTSTCRTFTGLSLTQPLEVRVVMDLFAKTATVYSKSGTEAEANHGAYAFTAATDSWDTYRMSSLNNSTDWGATDFVDVDYLRFKELTYPAPPTDFQRWMDTAEGSTTPSADKLPMADADHDGVKNLLEYAYGGHPYDPASRIMQHAGKGENNGFVFTLPVIPGANFSQQSGLLTASVNGLHCRILGSMDLNDFDAVVEEIFPSRESGLPPVPRGWEYRSFQFAPPSNLPAGFMKAEVEPQP